MTLMLIYFLNLMRVAEEWAYIPSNYSTEEQLLELMLKFVLSNRRNSLSDDCVAYEYSVRSASNRVTNNSIGTALMGSALAQVGLGGQYLRCSMTVTTSVVW